MSSLIVTPTDENAYEMIESAVMETSRGRWFLAEFARRNRHADTRTVLGAIDKLQVQIARQGEWIELAQHAPHPAPVAPRPPAAAIAPPLMALPHERLHNEIMEMARAIARTEREIRAIRADGHEETQFVSASDELDAVVATSEKAASQILSAAERVQEYAWTMREKDGDVDECDMLDECATEIYTGCAFHDVTAQRIRKVVETLRFLDQRLKSLLEASGLAEDFHADEEMIDALAEPPPPPASSNIWMSEESQAEIDDAFDFFEPAADESYEPTVVGADRALLDSDTASPPNPAEMLTRAAQQVQDTWAEKANAEKANQEAAAKAAPAAGVVPPTPYDLLSTEEKLRAFR